MRPAKHTLKSKIIAGTATLTLAAILLSVGSAHGRLIEWASTEYIYTPSSAILFSSDCLTQEGQTIQLKAWSADETTRTIEVAISGPEVVEPPVEDPTEAPTEEPTQEPTEGPTEGPTEEPTQEPTQTETTEPTVEETTGAPTDTPAAQLSGASQTESTEPTVPEVNEPENSNPENSDQTDPTDPTEPAEPDTEPTDPPVTPPKGQWTDGNTTITPDAVAAEHLTIRAEVDRTTIRVTLTRAEEAPGLTQAIKMTFHVQWQGLQGTFAFQMLPYGEAQPPETITDNPERQVVTGLSLFNACDVLDTKNPISVVRLNQQTCADFTLRFSCDNEPVYGVRWSVDGGKTYTMLYEESQMTVSWPYPENWNGVVCLDFGQALTAQQRPTIHVMATQYDPQEYSPVRMAVPKPANFVLPTGELPYLVEMRPVWGNTQLEGLWVERLTINEEGQPVYTEDHSLVATVENGGIRLTPSKETILPECGSYRLTILWSWFGVRMEECTVYFFVNTH